MILILLTCPSFHIITACQLFAGSQLLCILNHRLTWLKAVFLSVCFYTVKQGENCQDKVASIAKPGLLYCNPTHHSPSSIITYGNCCFGGCVCKNIYNFSHRPQTCRVMTCRGCSSHHDGFLCTIFMSNYNDSSTNW